MEGNVTPAPRSRGISLGAASAAFVAASCWVVGMRPLADNSFFTHLATGRLILQDGAVPTHDPYTFTASGEPWVVQSWLVSWLYATVEALAGATGLRVLVALGMGALGLIAWTLTKQVSSLTTRVALVTLYLLASFEMWAERPFMFGLLALGLVMLAADGRVPLVALLPLGWVWVNVHGSFPLGLAYLVVLGVGTRFDGQPVAHIVRATGWLAAGVVLGMVGPLGVRALVFPLDLLSRQDVLPNVIEWRAPTFASLGQRFFLVQLLVAVVLLVRRPRYRDALVVAVFGGAALLGLRNVAVASLVILPGMAHAAPHLGSFRSEQRGAPARLMAVAALVVAVGFGGARLSGRDFDLGRYPIDALAYLEAEDVDLRAQRMAAPEIVGNLREALYGARGDVFADDRFDMFPVSVTEDQFALVNSTPGLRSTLDDYEIEVVLWERTSPTAQLLAVDPGWRVAYLDESWLVACRRPLSGEQADPAC